MMECNKEEAIRAKDIAEKRMQSKDFVGARKIALKAQQLFPELDNISQLLTVCEVHCSAAVKVNGEVDWYGILQVEPSADDSSIKKQYRKLALLLHPDKNKFAGAEAAFKLIGEAHMTLSDRAKRTLHDIKRNANVKTASLRQPSQQTKQTAYARNNVQNMNLNGLNQQQQQPSAFSGAQTFWTICPMCGMRYQYYRTILNRALRCQSCMKPFIAYDLNAPTVPTGTSSGYSYNGSGIPPQQNPSQQVHNTSGQTQFGNASSSMAFQGNVGGIPAANSGHDGGPMNKTKDGKVDAEGGAGKEVKFEKVKLTEVNKKEQVAKPSTANTSQRRARKAVVESSDSGSTDSEDDSEDVIIQDGPPAERCAGADVSYLRRSTRQKQNVTYKEDGSDNDNDGDFMIPRSHKRLRKGGPSYNVDWSNKDLPNGGTIGVDVGSSENNIIEGRMDSKQKKGTTHDEKLPNGSGELTEDKLHESRQGTIEKEEVYHAGIDSSVDSSCKASPNLGSFSYPDPEFWDFEKFRNPNQFAVDQIWAVYDNLDGMPRFYARIRHVHAPGFKLRFSWLEYDPTNKAEMAWSDKELPVACGNFRLGKSEVTQDRLMFSHVISWEKGRKRNSYDIYPRNGEVWALYKDWDIGWTSDPDSHRLYEYEIVEVVSDFAAGTGISVIPLVKIKGFVSLFIRAKGKIAAPYIIPPNEILRFSHNIPSYRMTGAEREGIPKGCFELDSASLPNNFEEIFLSISLDSLTVGVENLDNECSGLYSKTLVDEEKLGTVTTDKTENMKCQNFSSHGANGICEEKYHGSASQHMATGASNHVNETKASRVEIDDDDVDPQNANAGSDAECRDPSTSSSQSPIYEYPEPEFHNFEEGKSIEKFQRGQIWALYSDIDKYPKYYGWIRKVELDQFRVHMMWLEACPSREAEKQWLGKELPIGCGTFKVSSGDVTFDTTGTFSHLVRARPTGRKNQYVILPCLGEIWAVYKNWHAGWTPSDFENCGYDVVEICERTGSSIKVSLLTKVNGFRAVFRPQGNGNSMARIQISEDEFLRFSHQIPAFQLTDERGGKLRGYWELDPASVPEIFLFTNVD